ncbi:mas-related G-protein coupled receptor member A6-like [Molossus molossus]|uniref:mas-related G-protein coupled receptor member A6-like n=1 Tax=Molossus molossus TaxID=27622 RepID=UPI0017466D6D|nr:mas-related G-protein coupled receptor member A6-like [Molossus molossus]
MAQEASSDARGFSPRPGPWQSHLSNGSVSPAEANATGNITQTPLGDDKSSFNYVIIVVAVVLLIDLFGLVGNGTVIWLLGFRVKRNLFSVYILNLAIADFLFLLCTVVMAICYINGSHYFPHIIVSFLFMSYLAGLTLLMAISTERCISALFPIWYRCHRPAHLSAIVCAVLWGLSLCLGVVHFVCIYYHLGLYDIVILIYNVTAFLTLLVLCVSSLTLLLRVHCGSWRRQTTKLYRVILLTVLAFLVLGLPLNVGLFIYLFFPSLFNFLRYEPIFYVPSVLNSAVNPVIYFFVGRPRHQQGPMSLRDVLQSALTEDA